MGKGCVIVVNIGWNRITNSWDDYFEEILKKSAHNKIIRGFQTNSDGMISLSNSNLEIRKQGFICNDKVLFPNPILRRHGTSNFVEINNIFKKQLDKGNDVEVRLDPFIVIKKSEYLEIIERDFFYGPNFSKDLLEKVKNFNTTMHYTNYDDSEDGKVRIQSMTYPIKYTIFRPSWIDKDLNQIQYYIEELLLPDKTQLNGREVSTNYYGKKYCAQKFVHFVYDRNEKCFEHIDGAIRIFKTEKYSDFFNEFQLSGCKDYNPHIPGLERYKLFKIKGKLTKTDVMEVLRDYFMYNPHIKEYFDKD
ncbi:hypothetical protein [Lactococcus garvieae]|uniref:hypothetical protein n=1 Tax=Lactococcus garvieae TaxID=1363 RepID=UPI003852632B